MEIETLWSRDESLLVTRFSGTPDADAVERWIASFQRGLDELPDGTPFKLLADFHGCEPSSVEAVTRMRDVIPFTLTSYGFRTALFDLFGSPEVPTHCTREVCCTALAHVHHHDSTMSEYERTLAGPRERFFTDSSEARSWIVSLPLRGEP